MNKRNVAALTTLIREWSESGAKRGLVQFLAGRGVLVLSALTDEQIWRFDEVQMLPHTAEPAAMRVYLERIAKGEV